MNLCRGPVRGFQVYSFPPFFLFFPCNQLLSNNFVGVDGLSKAAACDKENVQKGQPVSTDTVCGLGLNTHRGVFFSWCISLYNCLVIAMITIQWPRAPNLY